MNLKELNYESLRTFIAGEGFPEYRARQLTHWIYEKRSCSLEEITEFSKSMRESLGKNAYISNLGLLERTASSDGTEKYIFELEDGHSVESVLIPEADRNTLCISSQAGCAMGCRFCLTGRGGLKRNLSSFEIVDQVIAVGRLVPSTRITNIVLMGLGEPLHNLDEVADALSRITKLMKFSKRRITVSTSGLVPEMFQLPDNAPEINLAVSLNATTDKIRSSIMPVNRKYPLKTLLDACRKYPLPRRRRITFEYVLLDDVNDTESDAKRLVSLLSGIPSKVNIIPFNEFEGSGFRRPSDGKVLAFQNILIGGGLTALVRKSKGRDIMAACGQLRGKNKPRRGRPGDFAAQELSSDYS
jgi:23S rRNA (adenine2503-C2)-methyltransferase